MHNALLWGFEGKDNLAAIAGLAEKQLLTPTIWFSCQYEGRPTTHLSREKFRDLRWLDMYGSEYTEYPIDYDCYNFVASYQGYFASTYSRFEGTWPYFSEHTHFINCFNLLYGFSYALIKKNNISLCLFSDIPHEGVDIIIYYIAKYFEIPTIILSQSIFPKFFCMNNIEDYGVFPHMDAGANDYISIPCTPYTELGYMADIPPLKVKPYMRSLLKGSLRPKKMFEHSLTLQPKCDRSREYIANLERYTKVPDLTRPYVYFPLHLQPELTTSVLGGKYNDQLLAIELLSEMLPDDWIIYVKENPKQNSSMRPDIFFKRLSLLKNVELVGRHENTFSLIENAQFVATISGTVGWEAIKGGKNVLLFGMAWYQTLPGVFAYKAGITIEDITQFHSEHKELEGAANALLNRMYSGVISNEYFSYFAEYNPTENTCLITHALTDIVEKTLERHSSQ